MACSAQLVKLVFARRGLGVRFPSSPHASLQLTARPFRAAIDFLRAAGLPVPDDLPTGRLLGTVTITGCVLGRPSPDTVHTELRFRCR